MGLRYLLAGVTGPLNVIAPRSTWFLFRHPAIKNANVAHNMSWAPTYRPLSLMAFLGRNYLSDWFCATGRQSNGTLRSTSTRRKRFCSTAPSSTPVRFHSTSSAVAKDVVLFVHDRTRFVRLLSYFCAGQLLFWTYLAHFALHQPARNPTRPCRREHRDCSGAVWRRGEFRFWHVEVWVHRRLSGDR